MTPTNPAFQAVQPVSEAPGQAQQAAPATQPGQPGAEGAPQDPGFFGGPGMMLLMFVPLILLLFWQSRSQQKKQEQTISSLKKGDRVVTQSGLVGRLLEVDSRYAKLELAPSVRVQVLRSSLAGRDAEDAAASTKDDSKDKGDKESSKDDK